MGATRPSHGGGPGAARASMGKIVKTTNEEKNEAVKKLWHEAAVQSQREVGLFILKNLILLNGGGIVLLLTLLGSASSDAAFIVNVTSIKASACYFSIGLISALATAVVSYATVLFSNPYSGKSEIPFVGLKWVEPAYFLLGILSMGAFIFAIIKVVSGVSEIT